MAVVVRKTAKTKQTTSDSFVSFYGFISERREAVVKVINSLGDMSPNNCEIKVLK